MGEWTLDLDLDLGLGPGLGRAARCSIGPVRTGPMFHRAG